MAILGTKRTMFTWSKLLIRLENVSFWQFIYFFWLMIGSHALHGYGLFTIALTSLSRFILPASLSGTPFTIHIPRLTWPTFQVLQAIFCSRQSANFGFKRLLDDVWCPVSTFESTRASNYEQWTNDHHRHDHERLSPWNNNSNQATVSEFWKLLLLNIGHGNLILLI